MLIFAHELLQSEDLMMNNLRSRIYPLNAMQWEMYEEWSEDPTMTQYNLTVCVDVPRSKCSSDRMLSACQAVLDAQRYFHIHLILDAEGVPQVCEDAAMPATVHYQEMSDEEWEQGKVALIRPLDLFNEPCGRLHVVATPTKTIVGVQLHHMFFDGLSVKAAFNNIEDALHGRPVFDQGDLAAELNEAEVASYSSEAYQHSKEVYMQKFGGDDLVFADFCHQTDDPFGHCICVRPHIDCGPIDEGCKRLGVNFSIIFNAAYALTSLPVAIDVSPEQSVAQLIQQTKSALFCSMRHRIYPVRHLLRDLDVSLDDNGTELSVQGPFIYEYLLVDGTSFESYHIEPDKTLEHAMTIIILREDGYEIAVDGSSALYTEQQLAELARLTGEYAQKIAKTENETNTIGRLR